MRRLAVLLLALSLPVAGSQPSYKLRISVSKGASYLYRIRTTMDGGPGGRISFELRMRETCQRVNQGATTWRIKIEGVSSSGSGEIAAMKDTLLQMKGMEFTGVYDSLGQIVSMSVGDAKVGKESLGGTTNLVFSERPVRAGDSWSATQTVHGKPVRTNYTLQRVETYQRRGAYRIASRFAPGAPVTSTKPGLFLVERSSGKVFKANGAFLYREGDMSVLASYTVERL